MELDDLTKAIKKEVLEHNYTEEDAEIEFIASAQALLHFQCIYRFNSGQKFKYDFIRRNIAFYKMYFAVLGLEVIDSPSEQMIALSATKVPYPQQANRIKKDDTAILLCLRLIFDEARKVGDTQENGEVLTDTDQIYDRMNDATNLKPLKQADLNKTLSKLKRFGLIKFEGDDSDVYFRLVLILPGIIHATNEISLFQINQWALTNSFDPIIPPKKELLSNDAGQGVQDV